MSKLPIAKRPGVYIIFFVVKVPTMEGMAFIYIAADAYSEFVFNLGVEKDDREKTVLKNIYLLTENPDFLIHRDEGFTLVLAKYKKLTARINAIINPVNGTLMINKAFNTFIANPVLESLQDFFDGRK